MDRKTASLWLSSFFSWDRVREDWSWLLQRAHSKTKLAKDFFGEWAIGTLCDHCNFKYSSESRGLFQQYISFSPANKHVLPCASKTFFACLRHSSIDRVMPSSTLARPWRFFASRSTSLFGIFFHLKDVLVLTEPTPRVIYKCLTVFMRTVGSVYQLILIPLGSQHFIHDFQSFGILVVRITVQYAVQLFITLGI